MVETPQTKLETLAEKFHYKIYFPTRLRTILMWFMFFIILIIITLPLGPAGPTLSILFIIIGLFIGRLWTAWGRWLSERLIINPLIQYSDKNLEDRKYSFLTRMILGGNMDRSFLQLQSNDLDISSIKLFFRESVKIVLPYVAITITITRILYDLGLPINGSLSLGFFFSFFALGVYLPFSKIVEDAKIMIITENGSIHFSGGKVRSQLDGFFSVTGLVSGYTLAVEQSGIFQGVFVYIGILILIVLLGIPFLFPALYVYYKRHENLVNEFRVRAMKAGIYPAKTRAEVLTMNEFRELVSDTRGMQDTEEEPKSFMDKLKRKLMGLIQPEVEISEDEIIKFEQYGVWICNSCSTINSILQDDKCSKCGFVNETTVSD